MRRTRTGNDPGNEHATGNNTSTSTGCHHRTTTAGIRRGRHDLDAYWSDDGDSYYIVQTGLSDYDFCEAYLTNNGRRVGVDGYTIEETAGRERVTFEFYLPAIFDPPDFDGYEFECVDYGF